MSLASLGQRYITARWFLVITQMEPKRAKGCSAALILAGSCEAPEGGEGFDTYSPQ